MRPVLLGMNNPVSSDPRHALYPHPVGCAGWNLAKYSGLSHEEYLATFERRNILNARSWSKREALEASDALIEELGPRTVVLLGTTVGAMMLSIGRPMFCWWRTDAGGWWARIPHPSGLSREWNDPLIRACAEVFLQELANVAHA